MKKGLFKRIGSMLLAAALMIPTIAPAVQLVSAEAAQEKPFLVDFGAKGGITSLKKANDIYDTNYVRTNYGDLFGNVNTKFQYGGEQKSRYFYQCSGSGEITLLAPEGNTPKHYDNFTLECDLSFEGGTLDTGIMFRVNESSNVNNPHGYFLGFYNNEIRILDGKDWSIPVRVSFTPDRGRTYHVKLEVQGSSIKGYVDDMTTPIITFNDSRYTSGALGLRNYRGTLSADNITIDGVLVDDFESGTNDKWYAMNGTGWRVADQGESGWQTANTSGRTPEITRPDADTNRFHYPNMGGADTFDITQTFTQEDGKLYWDISVVNQADEDLILGDVMLPVPFNNEWHNDTIITQTLRVLPHINVSANSSYIYVNRVNGEGDMLAMIPLGDTALEYTGLEESSAGPSTNITAYIHSYATAVSKTGTWRQENTKGIIPAGEEKTWSFVMEWVSGTDGLREALYENGNIDIQVIPGLTIPQDLFARMAVRSQEEIGEITAEYPDSTTIEYVGDSQGYEIYDITFNRIGENQITVSYGDGRKAYVDFFSTEPLEGLIDSRYSHLAENQQIQNKNVWYDGLFSNWNMANQTMTSPDNRQGLSAFMVGGADDPTGVKAPALAQKNAIRPVQEEIDALEYYAENFVWGGLQRTDEETPYPYGVYGSDFWYDNRRAGTDYLTQNGGVGHMRMWRTFDYTHMFLFWYSMYQIADRYPDMVSYCTAEEYLERAYGTACAFFDVPYNIYMGNNWSFHGWCDWAYKQGNFNEIVLPDIIEALEKEGQTEKAQDLRTRWENKVKYMCYDHPYPFGSEMLYDTTAFESTHVIAKYGVENEVQGGVRDFYDKNYGGPGVGGWRSHTNINQEDFYVFMEKEIAANKATRETMATRYNQLGTDMRGYNYCLSYMTWLGGWSLMDYGLYYAEEPAEELRLAYASYLAPYCLINTGEDYPWWGSEGNEGALGWAYTSSQNGWAWCGYGSERGPWKFDGEMDAGLGGAVRTAASVTVDDPIFGLFGYGCEVAFGDETTTLIPKDGIRQRVHFMHTENPLHLIIDRDAVSEVAYNEKTNGLTLELDNISADAHTTVLSLEGLADGGYVAVVDGVRTAFEVTDGAAEVALDVPAEDCTVTVLSDVIVDCEDARDQAAESAANAQALADEAVVAVAQAQADAKAAQEAADRAKAVAEAAKAAAEEAAGYVGDNSQGADAAKVAAETADTLAKAAQTSADEAATAAAAAAKEKLVAAAAAEAKKAAAAAAEAADGQNPEEVRTAAQAAADAMAAAEKNNRELKYDAAAAADSAAAAVAAEESAGYANNAAQTSRTAQIAQKAAEDAKKLADELKASAEKDKNAAEAEKNAAEAAKKAAEAAQKAALDGAKYQAVLNLDTYAEKIDTAGYSKKQTDAMADILTQAKEEIQSAEEIEKIDEILNSAKEALDAVEDICPSRNYSDVAAEAWYHESVDYMIGKGYMNGVSDTRFDVNGSVTRAQLVTILYRTAGEPSVAGLENPFTDVEAGKWYTNAVVWAAGEGIVKGVSASTFEPNTAISRQQIVTILFRFADAKKVAENKLAAFTDAAKVAAYAADAMNWAVAEGIMNGVTATTLEPAATATRAQICAIVMRYLEK